MALRQLEQSIGYVSQDIFSVFRSSVRDNMLLEY